jgi:hypothetical protein
MKFFTIWLFLLHSCVHWNIYIYIYIKKVNIYVWSFAYCWSFLICRSLFNLCRIKLAYTGAQVTEAIDGKTSEGRKEFLGFLYVQVLWNCSVFSVFWLRSFLNLSAWGHLNPSSYCDVGRLFLWGI